MSGQIVIIHWIIGKAREFQINIHFCFIDCVKAFDCVDQNKLWKILEMGITDHLTYLLRNLYAGQEAIVRTRLVQNRDRCTSRLQVVSLLIKFICRVHHDKDQAG